MGSADRIERMEQELELAIEGMESALDQANGNCTRKIRRRTTKIRRALRDLAEEGENE